MEKLWEPGWDFWFAAMDDAPIGVSLDMNVAPHVPLASHPTRVHLRVQMKQPRPDGLRSGEEAQALFDLEDRIVAGRQPGHRRGPGRARALPRLHRLRALRAPQQRDLETRLLAAVAQVEDPYQVNAEVQADPDWGLLHRVPLARRLPAAAHAQPPGHAPARPCTTTTPTRPGWSTTTPTSRTTTGRAWRPRRSLRSDSRSRSPRRRRTAPSGAWPSTATRPSADGRIDEVTDQIVELVIAHDGYYDGWGCPVMRSG